MQPFLPSSVTADSSGQQKISPALLAAMTANPLQYEPVIVEMNAPVAPFISGLNQTLAQQASSILNANGVSFGGLSIIQGAAGVATAAGITAISQVPQVAAIELDSVVRARRPSSGGSNWTSSSANQLTSLYPQEVDAPQVWKAGGSGRGVGVVVLDSGVALDADLGTRVIASVGFAGPHDPAHPDLGGHGTHIAGTIAGSGVRSNGEYVGIAPNANIIDVQVIDGKGNARLSSVLRGIEWTVAHQAQFNIRVMNLSLGATPTGSYKTDPLAAACEVAWRHGIVVVVAAGNTGPTSGGVETPGIDPYVITVGSTDDQGSLALTSSLLGWWSAWGTPTDSVPRPDVVAPGRRVVAPLVPNSTLATRLSSDHIVYATNGTPYLRLTGTSMSTAVVSGEAALILGRQPDLQPDQVKRILTSATGGFGVGPLPLGAGFGLINTYTAYSSSLRVSGNAGLRYSDDAARLFYSLIYGQPLAWKSLTYLGTNWLGFTWLNLPWNDPTWDNIAWDNIAWDNVAWDNIAWDNIAWDNIAWDSSEWNNIAWDAFSYD